MNSRWSWAHSHHTPLQLLQYLCYNTHAHTDRLSLALSLSHTRNLHLSQFSWLWWGPMARHKTAVSKTAVSRAIINGVGHEICKSVYTFVIIQTTRRKSGEHTILDLFRHNVKCLGTYAAELRCQATVFNYLLLWLIFCFWSARSYGWMTDNGKMCVHTRGGQPNVLRPSYVKTVDKFHPVDSLYFLTKPCHFLCSIISTGGVHWRRQQQQLSSHTCSLSLSRAHQNSWTQGRRLEI